MVSTQVRLGSAGMLHMKFDVVAERPYWEVLAETDGDMMGSVFYLHKSFATVQLAMQELEGRSWEIANAVRLIVPHTLGTMDIATALREFVRNVRAAPQEQHAAA